MAFPSLRSTGPPLDPPGREGAETCYPGVGRRGINGQSSRSSAAILRTIAASSLYDGGTKRALWTTGSCSTPGRALGVVRKRRSGV
eukprot:597427-Alexandrium_andersonii.AAC.1